MEQSLVVPSLAATPNLLRALTSDASPEQVWQVPKPGEWSMGDVVRHLVAADERVFLPRFQRMLTESRPTFASVEDVLVPGRTLAPLLDAFEAERARLVALLRPLAADAWAREGVIPRGPVSVGLYADRIAGHDIEHRQQIHDVREALGLKPKRTEGKRPLPMARLLEDIARGPAAVRAAAEGMTAVAMRQRPREGEWSVKEIMAHFLKVERDLFLPRLRQLAEGNRPSFPSFDADAWARERDHREGDFDVEWRAFQDLRRQTILLLEKLPAGAAEHVGFSGFFGPVTLVEYATHVADHDIEHVGQIVETRKAFSA